MSEPPPIPNTLESEGRSTRTGDRLVDSVLASLDGLEQRPVAEHVAVFETAHDQLRAALADSDGMDQRRPPSPSAGPSPG